MTTRVRYRFVKPSELEDGNQPTESVWIGSQGATYTVPELKKLASDLRLARAADLHSTGPAIEDDNNTDNEQLDANAQDRPPTPATPMSDEEEVRVSGAEEQ